MKNYIISVLAAVLLGFICANFVFNEYKNKDNYGYDIYFLQVGSYSNLKASNDDLKEIKNKLTIKENDKYYSYIGITANLEEANRIKDLYKNSNIDVYIKKVSINDNNFYNELKQYDILLKNSNSREEMDNVLSTVLATFEEENENQL